LQAAAAATGTTGISAINENSDEESGSSDEEST
jgi:hypothetical protein